jgi:uncharacterized phiE125 gp8 family phage protein
MKTKITTPPVIEPISLDEAKLHLRISHTTEDEMISRVIIAARNYCEDITGRALINRTITGVSSEYPGSVITLPHSPLISIDSLKMTDSDGNTTTVSTDSYIVDTYAEPGQIVRKQSETWPVDSLQEVNGVEVIYQAGYGTDASDVPETIRQAMLLIIGHWYENREDVVIGQIPSRLPLAVNSLLSMEKVFIL